MSSSESSSLDGIPLPLEASLGESELLAEKNLSIAKVKTSPIDRLLDRGSEWFSAILVKETRQALKSRQFVWTFFLMLLVVATWAILSITFAFSTQGAPAELGPVMLCGFFDILGFPLAIIIPYSAYRSLAQEYEDGTLQMVAITTMRPYQIIAGKLGSAALQIMMYLAVLAPCISFTYLLRGVDIVQILFGLLVAVYGSFCLCAISLFLACGTRRRAFGIGMTVVLVPALGLLYCFGWCVLSFWIAFEPSFLALMFEPPGSVGLFSLFAFFGSTAVVAFVAAASQIAFDTENRSTTIRLAILAQQVLFIGVGVASLSFGLSEGLFWTMSMLYGHYWLAVGALLVASSPIISRRVRRSFPKTIFGKSLFGLMMPGAGRAYVFSIANLVVCAITFAMFAIFHDLILLDKTELVGVGPFNAADVRRSLWALVVNFVYPAFFLSVTYLIICFVKRTGASITPLFGLLVAVFMVFVGYIVGIAIQLNFIRSVGEDYTILQAFYWYGTAIEAARIGRGSVAADATLMVGLLTLILMGIALRIASKDFSYSTLQTPQRVLEARLARKKAKSKSIEPVETIEDIFNPRPADVTEES